MRIENAILHVLDFESGQTILSQRELALDDVSIQVYLDKLVVKFLDGDLKIGQLNDTVAVVKTIQDTSQSFIEMSQQVAQAFFETLKITEEARNGDLLILAGTDDEGQAFVGILKLNYKPAYTHFVDYVEDEMMNNIIMNKAILPSVSQRVDEGILLNIQDLSFKAIDKNYKIEGKRVSYITGRIFEVAAQPSAVENIKIVKKAVKSVADKYNVASYESLANVQQAIYESIEEEGKIVNEKIAEAVFEDNHVAKEEYMAYVERTHFNEDVPTNVPKLEKKYSKQKLKLANGIELFVPIELYQDKETIEFINNPDGTISVVIKNVEEIMNKF